MSWRGDGFWSLDIWKTEIVLRRSKIFIATGIQIAVSSVGAAYYGQHLHTDLHPYARALVKNTSSWNASTCRMTKDTFSNPWIPISRLDAAPTELIACCSPVTIKILLLRSIAGPTNVQTPAGDASASLQIFRAPPSRVARHTRDPALQVRNDDWSELPAFLTVP